MPMSAGYAQPMQQYVQSFRPQLPQLEVPVSPAELFLGLAEKVLRALADEESGKDAKSKEESDRRKELADLKAAYAASYLEQIQPRHELHHAAELSPLRPDNLPAMAQEEQHQSDAEPESEAADAPGEASRGLKKRGRPTPFLSIGLAR
jgi:hypothetical protein